MHTLRNIYMVLSRISFKELNFLHATEEYFKFFYQEITYLNASSNGEMMQQIGYFHMDK